MDLRCGCVLLVVAIAPSTLGCVGILGLDPGVPEDSEGSAETSFPDEPAPVTEGSIEHEATTLDHASAPDGPQSRDDSGREDAAALDVMDDRAMDASFASDATDAIDAVDATDATDSDAACRGTLQPCHANSDCCSGTCGVGLTCL